MACGMAISTTAPTTGPSVGAHAAEHHHGQHGRRMQHFELLGTDVLEIERIEPARDAGDAAADGKHHHLDGHGIAAERGERQLLVAHGGDRAAVGSVHDARDQPDRQRRYCRRKSRGRPACARPGDGVGNGGNSARSAGELEVLDHLQQPELESEAGDQKIVARQRAAPTAPRGSTQ